MISYVIVSTAQKEVAIRAIGINGGWSNPVKDANGLCAWGLWESQLRPDALQKIGQNMPGVELFERNPLNPSDYKVRVTLGAGWVDPPSVGP